MIIRCLSEGGNRVRDYAIHEGRFMLRYIRSERVKTDHLEESFRVLTNLQQILFRWTRCAQLLIYTEPTSME